MYQEPDHPNLKKAANVAVSSLPAAPITPSEREAIGDIHAAIVSCISQATPTPTEYLFTVHPALGYRVLFLHAGRVTSWFNIASTQNFAYQDYVASGRSHWENGVYQSVVGVPPSFLPKLDAYLRAAGLPFCYMPLPDGTTSCPDLITLLTAFPSVRVAKLETLGIV